MCLELFLQGGWVRLQPLFHFASCLNLFISLPVQLARGHSVSRIIPPLCASKVILLLSHTEHPYMFMAPPWRRSSWETFSTPNDVRNNPFCYCFGTFPIQLKQVWGDVRASFHLLLKTVFVTCLYSARHLPACSPLGRQECCKPMLVSAVAGSDMALWQET